MEDKFEELWKAKPKRAGSNPKELARIKFLRAVANGVDPEKIVAAAHAWAKQERENGTEEKYIAMVSTWLNQKRFNDFAEVPLGPDQAELERQANAKGWFWNGRKWEKRENAGCND